MEVERRAEEDRRLERRQEEQRREENIQLRAGQEQVRGFSGKGVALKPRPFVMGKDSFRAYINQYKIYCRAAKIPKSEQVDNLYTYLDNKALRRVGTLSLEDQDKLNPDKCFELMAELISGKETPAAARAKLHTISQGPNESISDYVARILETAEAGYEPADELKDRIMTDVFVRGINSEKILFKLLEEQGAEVNGPPPFEDVYKRALMLEGIHSVGNSIIQSKTRDSGEALFGGVYAMQDTEQKDQCWSCKAQGEIHDWKLCPKRKCTNCQEMGHVRQICTKTGTVGKPVICFKCRGEGHISSNCPNNGQRDNRTCFACQKQGHIASNCRSRQNQTNFNKQNNNNYNRNGNYNRNNSVRSNLSNTNSYNRPRNNNFDNNPNFGAGGFDRRLYEGGIGANNVEENRLLGVSQKAEEIIQRLRDSLKAPKN